MRSLPGIIFFCVFTSAGWAQSYTVTADELTFYSQFEQEAFRSVEDGATKSYFDLLVATDTSATQEFSTGKYQLYQSVLDNIQNSKFGRRSPEKKIKQVYKTLHEAFLRKYELKNTFSSLFRRGQYNCVSATALYALALDELGIAYAIRETPTHVYLVAYPRTERILLESTDPAGGYYAFDDKFKSEFVSQLRKRKLISEQEFSSLGVNALFDKHYFADEDISKQQLVGLQYCNDALYSMEEERYEHAYRQLEKAYRLYPSEKIAYLLQGAIAHRLAEIELSSPQYGKAFVQAARFHHPDVEEEDLVNEFRRFTYGQLTQAYRVAHYDSMYRHIAQYLADTSLVDEISHVYYQERGRIAYNKGNYSAGLDFLGEACRLRPHNVNNQSMLVAALGQKLNALADNSKRIELIEQYMDQFSFLTKNNVMRGQLVQAYLIQFGQAYEAGNEAEGETFRQKFEEQMLHRTGDMPINTDLIGRAYALAAVHHFRKGNESRTKSLLNRGLEYAPTNYELQQRKQMLGY